MKPVPFSFESLSFALNMMSRHKLFPKGEEEVWRDVDGYNGVYKISNYGRLKSFNQTKTGQILIPDNVVGYWRYALSKGGIVNRKTSHTLVAMHFIENPNGKPCVNHINGITICNHPKNLEWVTYAENTQHAYRTGLMNPAVGLTGKQNAKSKPVVQLTMSDDVIKVWDSINLAAITLDISPSSIGEICRGYGRKKSTGGFKWKFFKQ